jgi:alpha-glucosidase
MVRQSGDEWYMGAMTNREARALAVPLDFLDMGRWRMTLWRDAADADVNAEHLDKVQRTVNAGDTLSLDLAPAGGAVARFERL